MHAGTYKPLMLLLTHGICGAASMMSQLEQLAPTSPLRAALAAGPITLVAFLGFVASWVLAGMQCSGCFGVSLTALYFGAGIVGLSSSYFILRAFKVHYALTTSVAAAVLTIVVCMKAQEWLLKGNAFSPLKLTAVLVWVVIVYGGTNYLVCKLMKAKA